MRPEEKRVLIASTQIAIFPPKRAGHGGNAYVPWSLIEELRAGLEALGIDWRSLKETPNAS